jgi:hypothetical protein
MLQNLRWQTQDTDPADTAWRRVSLGWLIPQELGGSVKLAFPSGGVCCKIEIPLGSTRNETQA